MPSGLKISVFYADFQPRIIFSPFLDSYSKSVLEAYGLHDRNVELHLPELSCETMDIITGLKPAE